MDLHLKRDLGSQTTSNAVQSTAHSTTLHIADASTTASNVGATPTGDSGVFTTNSSPPLIVAFLAIGLFMAATLAVFGWRRMYMNRGLIVDGPRGGFGGGRRGDEFGETPELWDLWTREPTRNMEDMKWESMMPFSAVVNNPTPTGGSTPSPSRITNHLNRVQQHLNRPYHTALEKPPESDEPVERPTLQVAVAIVMPSPPKTRENLDEDEPLEYSLGMMEMPWRSEAG